MSEKVSFKTSDGVEIVGGFYPSGGKRAVLLLHMMPATRESWRDFAELLAKAGFPSLAIDLRGHGESVTVNDQNLDYKTFSDKEHQKSILDIEASIKFLAGRDLETFAIAGASIGANLALWYQAEHPKIAKSALLSAGFDYRGIKAKPLVVKLSANQSIYAVGGSKDVRSTGQDAGTIAKHLVELAPSSNKEVEVLETDAHGTGLFQVDPTLKERLIQWLGQ